MFDLPPERIDKFHDYLCQILDILTCHFCDKFIQNPLALSCNHRFCERCVYQQLERGKPKCFSCNKSFSKSTMKQQSQLKMYIMQFKKFIDLLYKENKSDIILDLYEYVYSSKKYNELKNLSLECSKENIEKNHESIKEINIDEKENLDDSINQEFTFLPKLCSTSVKPRNFAQPIFAVENSAIFQDQKNKLVDETIFTEDSYEQTGEIEKLTTTINSVHSSQADVNQVENSFNEKSYSNYNDTTILDSQEMAMVCGDISNENLELIDHKLVLNKSENDTYQTQSQYHVLKPTVTYSHKIQDKFDRVINMSTTTDNSTLKKDQKNFSNNASVTLDNIPNSAHSSTFTNRSISPELFFDDFGSEDDELLTSIF